MKTLTVRLPESLVSEIEAESRKRGVPKSDIVRERLHAGPGPNRRRSGLLEGSITDLIGSLEELPPDLSTRKKDYPKVTGYGRRRAR